MFTITHFQNGYRIKLYKDRSLIVAKDADEAATAVKHYFGTGCHGNKTNENCPICRSLMQREKKGKKS